MTSMYSVSVRPTSLYALSTYVVAELDNGVDVPASILVPVTTCVFARTDCPSKVADAKDPEVTLPVPDKLFPLEIPEILKLLELESVT